MKNFQPLFISFNLSLFLQKKQLKVHNSISSFPDKPSVVTIGTFDGVHIGHQKIIKRLISISKEKHLDSVLLTFFPHPRMVLQTQLDIKLINTLEERKTILSKMGLDHLVVKEFTKEFSRLSAYDYVKNILVDELKAKYIIIGYDHRFGKNRSADINDLKEFGKEFDFEVEEISAQDIENVAVSSTKIRKALVSGDIQTANQYLGYHFSLSGIVVKGKQLGSKLGFPTANIAPKEHYKLIPKNGAYVVKSNIGNKSFYGMLNIGTNPTVNGSSTSIEVHFFNFNQDLYGKTITVEFIDWLRNEEKFHSLEQLQIQLHKDQQHAQKIINNCDE